ncbi:MAG: hypothetical protein KF694_11345 [Mesorhizobium sp.]|nr:hypothetical protein [Mesorhizobium sp.]
MTFSLKTSLIAGSIAFAALAGSLAPAKADSVGVWVGPGIGIGGVGVGVGFGVGVGHGHYGHGYGYYGDYAGGYCSKGEALGRAASMGVKKRYVSGVSSSRISVRGTHKGQPVKVTMYRHSDHCAVRSFNYL